MKQVMNESLRLSVLAPWAAKVQDVDIELGGYVVPKGVSNNTKRLQWLKVQHQHSDIRTNSASNVLKKIKDA